MTKRSRNTKAKIVSAAWELFYRQGYDATTIDEIVEVSETSKGSFYHYFKSKDSLLGSLSDLFDEKYTELQETLDPNANSFDTLIYLNQQLFEMIDNRIDQTLITKLYSTQLVTNEDKALLDSNRQYYRLLKRIVTTGQERGELRRDLTANEIVRIYAMCERAMINDWCLYNHSYSLKSYSYKILPLLLAKIREGE
ncbi:MAG: TetR/AcrR family transcriptional regulator [Clostridiales bacterium]|nr:TetR/AcrR family transcriptional regulator [Clostridiales bacterium]